MTELAAKKLKGATVEKTPKGDVRREVAGRLTPFLPPFEICTQFCMIRDALVQAEPG